MRGLCCFVLLPVCLCLSVLCSCECVRAFVVGGVWRREMHSQSSCSTNTAARRTPVLSWDGLAETSPLLWRKCLGQSCYCPQWHRMTGQGCIVWTWLTGWDRFQTDFRFWGAAVGGFRVWRIGMLYLDDPDDPFLPISTIGRNANLPLRLTDRLIFYLFFSFFSVV